MEITLPYKFTPRHYQEPVFAAFESGIRRAYLLWHRRAGKDKTFLNLMNIEAHKRKGTYYYFYPTFAQARRAIWEGCDKDGFKFTDHFPEELISKKNDGNMRLELKCGSSVQLIGTDNYDSIRSTNPIGCIFSEHAFQDPQVWDVVRPILLENGGWAAFVTTPNGKNHAYKLWEAAQDNPQWYTQKLTINDTHDENGKQLVTRAMVDQEIREGMSKEMVEQEFYCSFEIGAVGTYYSDQMLSAWQSGRITAVPVNKARTVDVYFDLGIDDATSVWILQPDGMFVNFIKYYENHNKEQLHYAQFIKEYLTEHDLKLGTIWLPHDAKKRDIVTGKNALSFYQHEFGIYKVRPIGVTSVQLGINAVRGILPKCRFDEIECARGIECLENYRKKYNYDLKVFTPNPQHDWASHGADAFRMFAINYKSPLEQEAEDEIWTEKEEKVEEVDYEKDL